MLRFHRIAAALAASLVFLAMPAPAAIAALPATSSGSLDPTFGGGTGIVAHSYATHYDYFVKALIQPDGKYVAVGYGAVDNTYGVGFVGRHMPDGSFDPSFNGSGRRVFGDAVLEYSIVDALLQPDGKLIVLGNDYRISVEKTRGWVARLTADGSLDTGFGAGGSALFEPHALAYHRVRTGALLPGGKILVAGYAENESETITRPFTARLNADGTLDASYGSGGISSAIEAAAPNFRPIRMAVLADGRLVLSGETFFANATPRFEATLVRLHADGSGDAGFAAGGRFGLANPAAYSSEFDDLLVDAQGGVTAVGWSRVSSVNGTFLVRLSADGVPDPAFGQGGMLLLPAASANTGSGLVRMDDGRMIVSGISTKDGDRAYLARLLPDGQLDQSFGIGGFAHYAKHSAAAGSPAVDAEGRIIMAGRMHDAASNGTNTLLARVIGTEITTPVIEFHNGPLNHYFVTADPNEAAAIDAGAAGPGWTRTGQTFNSGGPSRVCRFYGSPDIDSATGMRRGPNSHFYTIDSAECGAVKTDAGWKFESYDYNGWPGAGGACPDGTLAVKRVYNGRWQQNDSNHRYVTTEELYAQMTALGWHGEGTVFCARV